MARRRFLSQLIGLPFLALGAKDQPQESKKALKIMMRSSWGTDDPSRGSFVFAHALALADAGHEVQIFLTGDATYLMRKATSDAVTPIGWPALSDYARKSSPNILPCFPAELARERVGLQRLISPLGARNTGTQPFLFRWLNGLIG